jgi:hypothetical protein
MHAELPHLIACRGHDAAIAAAAHDHGFAAQLRAVTLLDGRVEGVHVDVQDRTEVHVRRPAGRLQRQRRIEQQAENCQRHEEQVAKPSSEIL